MLRGNNTLVSPSSNTDILGLFLENNKASRSISDEIRHEIL